MRSVFCLVGILLICNALSTSALKCRVCNAVTDVSECFDMQECFTDPNNPKNSHVCQNDFQQSNNKVTMTKSCKQRLACQNEVEQDDNVCDLHGGKDTVCRCCCETDDCNKQRIGCISESNCPWPGKPRNGQVKCGSPIKKGDKCTFTCNKGFQLDGQKITTCVESSQTGKLEWNPPTIPQCVKQIIRCRPPHRAPRNGKMTCKNTKEHEDKAAFNFQGSVCNFECNKFFKMRGKPRSTCMRNGQWNRPAPTCKRGSCDDLKPDKNRIDTCTAGKFVGSQCSFECKKGFRLVGTLTSICEQVKGKISGEWSEDPPRCERIICRPKQVHPINGKVSCTNQNFEDSVCTFTCNVGYDLDDITSLSYDITCERDEESKTGGRWSGPPATCSQITCLPRLSDPEFGDVDCTASNTLGSVCTYTCNSGYDLDGTAQKSVRAVCKDDKDGDNLGKWSRPPGTCSPIICEPAHSDPENGNVLCTNENYFDSICTFRCDDKYDLDKTVETVWRSKCVDDGDGNALGTWNRPPATCSPIKCNPKHRDPENGSVTCTAANFLTSDCTFKCNVGYKLDGIQTSTCTDMKVDGDAKGEWTSEAPTCVIHPCENPVYDEENVIRDCGEAEETEVMIVGTVCKYTCSKQGYYMTPHDNQDKVITKGEMNARCLANQTWSFQPPDCHPITCRQLKTPNNGHPPECTAGIQYQSRCTFTCKLGYGLTHERPLDCESDDDKDQYGKWSEREPQCSKNTCDEFGQIKHGYLNCSDGVNVGSVCDLICNERYIQKRYRQTTCVQRSADRKPDWDRRKYVCCVPCIFNPFIRIVFVVDKTAAQTQDDWYNVVDFLQYTLYDLRGNGFKVNVGYVMFDEEIDSDHQYDLTQMKEFENIDDLVWAMEEVPFGGKVSNAGKAMKYAKDEMFVTLNNEEPYIIVLLGGRSKDDVKDISKTIRDSDINLLAVGYETEKSRFFDEDYLLDITANKDNQFQLKTLADLIMVRERITKISQLLGCSATSTNQNCPK